MPQSLLPHAKRIEDLLRRGNVSAARRVHNEHVEAELEKAKREPVNLSDLIAADEAFHLHECDE